MQQAPRTSTVEPPRSRRWRRALGSGIAALAVGAVMVAVPGVAAAQTGSGSGGFPGGGPVASGSVLSISGSTIEVQGSNGQANATVTVSDTTTYQKNQEAPAGSIVAGDCVRVSGKGNAKKGITAATIALSEATSDGCSQFPGGGGPGAGGASGGNGAGGFPNGANGQVPPGNGNGTGNGGSNQPPSGGNRPRFNVGGTAFGTVKSVSGSQLVVKATTFSPPKNQNSAPKLKTQNVKVTLSSSTKVTANVAGVATDVAVGKCVVATGTGDSGAVSADNVRLSDPQDGKCNAFGSGGPTG